MSPTIRADAGVHEGETCGRRTVVGRYRHSYEASFTLEGFHVPSRMDGGFSLGQ